MASGIAVQLPLVFDDVFGPYNLITDYLSLARQNLKMLVSPPFSNPSWRIEPFITTFKQQSRVK